MAGNTHTLEARRAIDAASGLADCAAAAGSLWGWNRGYTSGDSDAPAGLPSAIVALRKCNGVETFSDGYLAGYPCGYRNGQKRREAAKAARYERLAGYGYSDGMADKWAGLPYAGDRVAIDAYNDAYRRGYRQSERMGGAA